ncbi:MAG: membrane dipeptidase [Chitinophagales bacterium]|nr:membrane dipeptidase [Chitinophagales bacterium]
MKKLLQFIFAIIVLYVIVIFTLPQIIDTAINRVAQKAPYTVSKETQDLYNSLDFIADLHCDALLWKRNLNKENGRGQVDIPRLIEARVALQAFTIVSKVPWGINFKSNSTDSDLLKLQSFVSGRKPKTWWSPKNRALAQCDELKAFAKKSDGRFRVIYNADDFKKYLSDRKSNTAITAGFLGAEGLYPLMGDINNLDVLYDAGIRMMSAVHFQDNELGSSAHGESLGGLTDFGKEVVKVIEQKNIILDVAHCSPNLIDDVTAIYHKPFISSHTGVKGTCPSQRNLSDKHLKAIANSGGLIGIAIFEEAVCGLSAEATAQAMKYTADLVGVEHIALGTDNDGAVKTPYDIRGLNLLVEALLKVGFSHEDIRLIMGENVKRFLLEKW